MSVKRGTANRNARGNSNDRRRRREWLVKTFAANVGIHPDHATSTSLSVFGISYGDRACRCYRCGALLSVDMVTVDRIIPGCQGGTYARTNIRPACSKCNSETGGSTRRRP